MRVAKWLTGLLYQLSLFITRSWEVHFHPRQGKLSERRLQQRAGGSGPAWDRRPGVGERAAQPFAGTLALQGLPGLPD